MKRNVTSESLLLNTQCSVTPTQNAIRSLAAVEHGAPVEKKGVILHVSSKAGPNHSFLFLGMHENSVCLLLLTSERRASPQGREKTL